MYADAMVPGYAGEDSKQLQRAGELEVHIRDGKARTRADMPNLRSCNDVFGYHIHAVDGDIGHVTNFLVDDKAWVIRYLVMETSPWCGNRIVLVSPRWIGNVDWCGRAVRLDVSRASIENAPSFDATFECRRDHELKLYTHFHRTGYWAGSTAR